MQFKENDRTEFKEIINADFKKEIVAFANTNGGDIYVGVSDDGAIVGIENADKEMQRITSMIHDGIHPDLIPYTSMEVMEIDSKEIIHLSVSRGGKLPYHLTDKGLKPSGVYVRHGVSSVPASEDMIRRMLMESDGTTYDKARCLNQELTFLYAEEYFAKKNVSFTVENKRTLGLTDSDGYYTNAALLLSDQCEHSIKCAIFQGNTKTVFKSRKEFDGSILKQLEDVYEYIELNNNVTSDFVGLDRVDNFDYPAYALREALLNSIVHRDYGFSASTVINIYDDRIEFVSIGGLVSGLTLEAAMRGVSQSRNTVLANIFYRLRLIESYGTGIQRIMDSYKGFSHMPEFLTEKASFITVLYNRNYAFGAVENGTLSDEEKVLALFVDRTYITRKDVEKALQCSAYPALNVIKNLVSDGKIKAEGNARATKYILK